MKREMVIIGCILVVIGAIEFLIEYYQVSTLMNLTGIVLLIFGIFLFIVGVASSEMSKSDYDAIVSPAKQKAISKQVSQSSASKQTPVQNCPKCGRQVPSDAHLCPYCGYDILECR